MKNTAFFLHLVLLVSHARALLLSSSSELTRIAGEAGTEGKLSGQAQVPAVAGSWRELTDNVNAMAFNLTGTLLLLMGAKLRFSRQPCTVAI
jgi:hypothetical protein